MSDGFGGVPVEMKVAALDGEVGGDDELFCGARSEHGAIVTDTDTYLRAAPGSCADGAQNVAFGRRSLFRHRLRIACRLNSRD